MLGHSGALKSRKLIAVCFILLGLFLQAINTFKVSPIPSIRKAHAQALSIQLSALLTSS